MTQSAQRNQSQQKIPSSSLQQKYQPDVRAGGTDKSNNKSREQQAGDKWDTDETRDSNINQKPSDD